MKRLILSAVAAIFCFSMSAAFAADAENSESTTVDHSKNPLTGTKKTTVTHKAKKKHDDGSESKMKQKETTKEKSDGKVERETESKSSTKSED